MRNNQISLIVVFLLATVLCFFGQETAYFLSENSVPIHPVYYLTGMTVLGIFLYLIAGFLLLRLFKKQGAAEKSRMFYLLIFFIVAPSASAWAFFVTVMWWG
ncbi:hypothetical protein [Indiicoccus explosivorum]|uniref:hypothetical protein n=1 Tax=Indiicoccus explosivorum TaxID=1917864 RepID=UPI000B450111|nr:hypothetical protein [Indiicoccus explosivorum]